MMMWRWCAREGGGEASAVGGDGLVGGRVETRGTGGGGCDCRWVGRGGGGTVVESVQPASRSKERRK